MSGKVRPLRRALSSTDASPKTGITRHTPFDDLPEFLKVEELAKWLGIGRGTAYSLVASGQIKAVRLGRLVRIAKSELSGLAR